MNVVRGRAWVFGDNIDTDLLAPGPYMKKDIVEQATHCLETVAPTFAREVRPGDVVIGGENFGMGSSREQAVQCLRHLGVSAVLALSFARIFYRNALNLGLPALFFTDAGRVHQGDRLEVDPETGQVRNLTQGTDHGCPPIPGHLLSMIRDGGLMPHLKKRMAKGGMG